MLKSSLCDYSNVYLLVSRTITVTPQAGDNPDNVKEKVFFKNCALFTDSISEINNTQIDNAKDIDLILPIYKLIEYSDNYSKALGSLWQYYSNELALNNAGPFNNFTGNNVSFNLKINIIRKWWLKKMLK